MPSFAIRLKATNLFAGGTSHQRFRDLAEVRVREARALFDAGMFDGAYYLAGYAIECALKAIIVKAIPPLVLPPPKSVEKLYTHDLHKLIGLGELSQLLSEAPPGTRTSWTVVAGWSEQRRYEMGQDRANALALLDSIDDPNDGILPWLKQHW